MKKIGLISVDNAIDLDKLEDQKAYPVNRVLRNIKIGSSGSRIVVLEYHETEVLPFDAHCLDLLIIGTIPQTSAAGTEYNQACVIYKGKQWWLVSDHQLDVFTTLSGIKPEDAKKLRDTFNEEKIE